MSDTLTYAQKIFEHTLRYIGLGDFKSEMAQSSSLGREYIHFNLTKSIEVDYGAQNSPQYFIDQYLKPIAEAVQDSEAVKGELAAITKERNEYKAALDEAIKYKIHFDMEMKLRHGDKK